MKMKKVLWLQSILIGMLCTNALLAQKQVPLTPWTLGVDMGFNLVKKCVDCDNSGSINIDHSATMQVNYRLKQWIGLTANLGYYRQELFTNDQLWNADLSLSTPVQRNSTINLWALSIGPRLLLRIWQGDLAVELRYGIAYHSPRSQAVDFLGTNYDVLYKPDVSLFRSLRVGYTYWPKARFGVTLGGEVVEGSHYKNYKPRNSTAFNSETISQLAPSSHALNFINITIGGCYRF